MRGRVDRQAVPPRPALLEAGAHARQSPSPAIPFKASVTAHLTSSLGPRTIAVTDDARRIPTLTLRALARPPGAERARGRHSSESERLFFADPALSYRATKVARRGADLVPVPRHRREARRLRQPTQATRARSGPRDSAITDRAGKARVFDLPLDEGREGPGGRRCRTATGRRRLQLVGDVPLRGRGAEFRDGRPGAARWAATTARVAMFDLRQGGGRSRMKAAAFAAAPMFQPAGRRRARHARALSLYALPRFDATRPGAGGLGVRAAIEVAGMPDRSLHYRVFGLGEDGKTTVLRSSGPLRAAPGRPRRFGGGRAPMAFSFEVEELRPESGREGHLRQPRPARQQEERRACRRPASRSPRAARPARSGSSARPTSSPRRPCR